MTDNIFKIETTALAHVACAPQESGVLLTDFGAAYPSVNHSWIFSVLENTGLPGFLCRFLRSIDRDSITHVEFAGAERGQFLMAKRVRQGCPASGQSSTKAQHVVSVQKATADFREAQERRHASPSQTHGANKHFSPQFPVQKRPSIYNWNPGPRRGKEDAFEKQIAGKWRIITLQEAFDYVDHEILTERFHVTHYAGCAILFNEDTFYPDINVKSIYLHDSRRGLPDQIIGGEQGCVLQGVLSRASFRRAAISGQKFFTVFSLHISNIYAKKKGIAKKLTWLLVILMEQRGDAAAETISVLLMKPLQTVPCLRHRAPHRCGDLDPFRTTGQTFVAFGK